MMLSMLVFSMTACSKDESEKETATSELNTTIEETTTEQEKSGDILAESKGSGEIVYSYEELDDGTISVYLYETDTPPEVFEVPSEIDGKTVTAIERLFYQEDTVKKVILPETVTIIGKESFLLSTSIEEVEIKGVVEKVGTQAFMQCEKLKSITFKEGLKEMEPYGVYLCPNLVEAHMPGSVEEIYEKSNLTACSENLTIYAPAGSIFEDLANEVGINFQAE